MSSRNMSALLGSKALRTMVVSIMAVVAVYVTISYIKDGGRSLARQSGGEQALTSNVSIHEGKQYIDLTAKGGYEPRNTIAKAHVATTLQVITDNSYGCETSMVIPALKRNGRLEPSATKAVDIPPQEPGTSLQGMCGMGMYRFAINFVK